MKKLISALLVASGFPFATFASAPESPAPKPLSIAGQAPEKALEEDAEGIVLFTPPPGWRLAEASSLPAHVRAMVVGSGPSSFPPSMNLSWEPFKGSLKQYLKTVKNLNSAQGYEWKDLGSIKTEAGNASLSQVDTKSQWGNVRLMHVILINNGHVYILTASALKDEFSIFYKDFFASMRSLRVANDLYDMVVEPLQRSQLKTAADNLQSQWKTLLNQQEKANPGKDLEELEGNTFESPAFQSEYWKPFQDMLQQKYGDLGAEWQSLYLKKMENQLFKRKIHKQLQKAKTT